MLPWLGWACHRYTDHVSFFRLSPQSCADSLTVMTTLEDEEHEIKFHSCGQAPKAGLQAQHVQATGGEEHEAIHICRACFLDLV